MPTLVTAPHPLSGFDMVAIGTVLAFMMATVAISLPEFVISRQY